MSRSREEETREELKQLISKLEEKQAEYNKMIIPFIEAKLNAQRTPADKAQTKNPKAQSALFYSHNDSSKIEGLLADIKKLTEEIRILRATLPGTPIRSDSPSFLLLPK